MYKQADCMLLVLLIRPHDDLLELRTVHTERQQKLQNIFKQKEGY